MAQGSTLSSWPALFAEQMVQIYAKYTQLPVGPPFGEPPREANL